MKLNVMGLILASVLAAPVAAQVDTVVGVTDAVEVDAPVAEIADETAVEGLQILEAVGIDPSSFLWERRIVAVLADSPNDPAFVRQLRDIMARPDELFDRDVVVIIDSDRNSDSLLRRMLRPRGFMLAIIGKDGQIKQRRPAPRSVREISSAIDHFPLRRQEILERMPAGR